MKEERNFSYLNTWLYKGFYYTGSGTPRETVGKHGSFANDLFLLMFHSESHKRGISAEWQRASSTPGCLKSLFTVAKATAPLVQISDNRPQTKGETTSPHFRSLVCSYCPVCKKIKLQSLRYIHHLTFLARVGSVRWVCGDLEGFFWSSAYSVLKRHQEKLHWFFSFWLLLNFCTES